MQEPLRVALLTAYVAVSLYFFSNWLKFCNKKQSRTIEDSFLSIVIVLIVTVLWPIGLPSFLLSLLRSERFEVGQIMPVILTVFMFSVLTLVGVAILGEKLGIHLTLPSQIA